MNQTVVGLPLEWLASHRVALDTARATIRSRACWSAFAETPSGKIYGETARTDGEAAFRARLGTTFDLHQPGVRDTVAPERSPFGLELNVRYPISDAGVLIAAAEAALPAWAAAGPDVRTGVALQMLARLNTASFELAYATMHTTGQPFVMAFQAGGPHAQDRALEAIAYAYDEMARVPASVVWEKPQGKADPLRIEKTFAIVPRGIALAIGCSTFPNWNAYPGMFASLVTGNALIVKPHPGAILPLAISVEIMRAVLHEAGFDPQIVTLAVDTVDAPIARTLVARSEIGLIDYTGSSEFGTWLERNATVPVFTEKAGVNGAILDSTNDYAGMLRNLALSVCLYSGQMCTTPQNIFVPRTGIATNVGPKSFADVVTDFVAAIDALVAAPERAAEIVGAIAAEATIARIDSESVKPGVVRASGTFVHPQFPSARIRTPLVVRLDANERDRYDVEMFGPIVYLIAADSTAHAFALATDEARAKGAITAILHSVDPDVIAAGERAAARGTVSLAINLTGTLLANQSSAFSDFHVSGGNPAGNASLTDAAFVANRFRIAQTRRPSA